MYIDCNLRKNWNRVFKQPMAIINGDLRRSLVSSNTDHASLINTLKNRCNDSDIEPYITYSENNINEVNKFAYLLNINDTLLTDTGDDFVTLSVPCDRSDNGYGEMVLPKTAIYKTNYKSNLDCVVGFGSFVDIDLGGYHDSHIINYVKNGQSVTDRYRSDRCMKWFNLTYCVYDLGKSASNCSTVVDCDDMGHVINEYDDYSGPGSQNVGLLKFGLDVAKECGVDLGTSDFDVVKFSNALKHKIDSYVDENGVVKALSFDSCGIFAACQSRLSNVNGRDITNDDQLKQCFGLKNKAELMYRSLKDGVKDGLYVQTKLLTYSLYSPEESLLKTPYSELSVNQKCIVDDLHSFGLHYDSKDSLRCLYLPNTHKVCVKLKQRALLSEPDSPYYDPRVDSNIIDRGNEDIVPHQSDCDLHSHLSNYDASMDLPF